MPVMKLAIHVSVPESAVRFYEFCFKNFCLPVGCVPVGKGYEFAKMQSHLGAKENYYGVKKPR
ncbi:hypothetical protein CA11_36850 [Gimesia maris]|nr:hypothetical protein CA11_36850 [Gimesia maris]